MYRHNAPNKQRTQQATLSLVFGNEVKLQTHGLDKYGRILADMLLPDGTHINHTLVKDGWRWWYRIYTRFKTRLVPAKRSFTR
jgi:endonuclease YncB( thermonuclease family)